MEGVADGCAETKDVVGMEVDGVIDDPVVVCFGADKEAPPEGVADAGADVKKKMIAIQMGGATGVIAVAGWRIEKCGLAARASREIGSGFLGQEGRIHSVEIVKHGAVELIVVIVPLVVSISNFRAVAVVILENPLDADTGVDAASLGRGQISFGSGDVLGREESGATDGDVKSLGISGPGKQNKRTYGHQSSELYSGELESGEAYPGDLSQIQPPFRFVLWLIAYAGMMLAGKVVVSGWARRPRPALA